MICSVKVPHRQQRTNMYAPLKRTEEEQREVIDPEDDEQFLRTEDLEVSEWKKCPQWDISYRQQVTASDVFLQVHDTHVCVRI